MPRKPNIDVMGDALEKIGLEFTFPQKQKLCNLAIDIVAGMIARLDFTPKKPMGYLTRFINSMDSALLPEDERERDQTKTGQRHFEIKPKDKKGMTRLKFKTGGK